MNCASTIVNHGLGALCIARFAELPEEDIARLGLSPLEQSLILQHIFEAVDEQQSAARVRLFIGRRWNLMHQQGG